MSKKSKTRFYSRDEAAHSFGARCRESEESPLVNIARVEPNLTRKSSCGVLALSFDPVEAVLRVEEGAECVSTV
jgi:hypothetical protein